jgi:hypothetical protein
LGEQFNQYPSCPLPMKKRFYDALVTAGSVATILGLIAQYGDKAVVTSKAIYTYFAMHPWMLISLFGVVLTFIFLYKALKIRGEEKIERRREEHDLKLRNALRDAKQLELIQDALNEVRLKLNLPHISIFDIHIDKR